MGAIANRAAKDRARRAKLRAKLRSEGVAEALIDKIIEQQRYDDLVNRNGLDRARDILSDDAHRHDPDDTGYQPSVGDPLLRGPARVDGIAAKVVRRQHTITRFQHGRLARRGGDTDG